MCAVVRADCSWDKYPKRPRRGLEEEEVNKLFCLSINFFSGGDEKLYLALGNTPEAQRRAHLSTRLGEAEGRRGESREGKRQRAGLVDQKAGSNVFTLTS